jgi:hypothetical protein
MNWRKHGRKRNVLIWGAIMLIGGVEKKHEEN